MTDLNPADPAQDGGSEPLAATTTSQDLVSDMETVKAQFRTLCGELHIPFLDVKLYEKYVMVEATPDNLYRLCLMTKLLVEHRRRTLVVLRCIQRREKVLYALFSLIHGYVKGVVALGVFQGKGLRLLQALQGTTLQTLEAIAHWRKQLTRPFPFMHRGLNYVLKVAADTHVLTTSPLTAALALTLYDFPLCSNMPNRAHFEFHLQAVQGIVVEPGMLTKTVAKYQKRLKKAEAALKQELTSQQGLIKEVQALTEQALFLPVLNTPLVPGCSAGISVRSSAWRKRIHAALQQALTSLTVPVSCMPGGSPSAPDHASANWEEAAMMVEEEQQDKDASFDAVDEMVNEVDEDEIEDDEVADSVAEGRGEVDDDQPEWELGEEVVG